MYTTAMGVHIVAGGPAVLRIICLVANPSTACEWFTIQLHVDCKNTRRQQDLLSQCLSCFDPCTRRQMVQI
jgi:hypothetical protein